jgi:hypothetical protein
VGQDGWWQPLPSAIVFSPHTSCAISPSRRCHFGKEPARRCCLLKIAGCHRSREMGGTTSTRRATPTTWRSCGPSLAAWTEKAQVRSGSQSVQVGIRRRQVVLRLDGASPVTSGGWWGWISPAIASAASPLRRLPHSTSPQNTLRWPAPLGLRVLDLSANALSGAFPSSFPTIFFPTIEVLNISFNKFSRLYPAVPALQTWHPAFPSSSSGRLW